MSSLGQAVKDRPRRANGATSKATPPAAEKPTSKAIRAQYDAAGQGRRARAWKAPQTSANTALRGLETIRARAQDAVRNDWTGESSVQKWTTSMVGVGITPRWKNKKTNKLFKRWARKADAASVLDYYGLQALACREWMAGGEAFVRRRRRPMRMGLAVPMQLQVLGSEMLPVFDADTWPGMPTGNTIKSGVEVNAYDERVAYWFYKQHPNEGMLGSRPSEDALVRVRAEDVCHLYELKRAGQMRGVSPLASVLMRLRSTGDFEDTVLERQKLANLFTVFFQRDLPPDWSDLALDPDTGMPACWSEGDDAPTVALEPGMSQTLLPGEKATFANPPGAGVDFAPYLRSALMGTASGQGLPYELMSGDIQNVSDRTLRVVINEFRRFAEQRQWHNLIPQFCQRVVEWFAEAAVLQGAITVAELEEAQEPEHVPHGWAYIHPVQDAQGKILELKAGLTSRTRIINAKGDNPEDIDDERKADQDREDKLGLAPPEPDPTAGGPAPAGSQGKKRNGQAQASAATPGVDLGAMFTMMGQMMATMQQMLQATATQGGLTIQAVMPQGPAPVVHVAPSPVAVSVPVPHVQVTNAVNPSVTVDLPDRQTVATFVRNAEGDIIKATTTETSI